MNKILDGSVVAAAVFALLYSYSSPQSVEYYIREPFVRIRVCSHVTNFRQIFSLIKMGFMAFHIMSFSVRYSMCTIAYWAEFRKWVKFRYV